MPDTDPALRLPLSVSPASPVPADEKLPGAPNLQNGTYTISGPEGHYTLKIHTSQRGKFAGRRIISLLIGPQNETDYRGVAFWEDEEQMAYVWIQHKHPLSNTLVDAYSWSRARWSKVEKKIAVMLSLALRDGGGYWGRAGYELLLEGRCVVCNRKLTTPESIRSGIGPVCAARR